ncbi:MAG: Fur family transcriptional regulator [Candidatus Woesearchaeota archaeon]
MAKSRQTRQKELLQTTIASFKEFFNAEDVLERARKKDSEIGLATVYRFLKEQANEKHLHAYQCNRRTIYSKQKNHCHYICEKSGKIIHFDVDSLDFLKKIIPGTITSFQLEVRGVSDQTKTKNMHTYHH